MPNLPLRYGFLLLDGFSNMVLASAVEPLRVANYCAGKAWFDWILISNDGEAATSSSGLRLMPEQALDAVVQLECLFVICGYGARQHSTTAFLARLRKASRGARLLGGIDAGAWILAEAGLLEGKRATMHWLDLADFEEEFPNVLVSDQRFVVDGRVMTAGGATTVLELMLRIIRDTCGEAVAFDVTNTFVYNSERLGYDQRGARSLSISIRVPQLTRAIEEMRSHMSEPLSIPQIAMAAGCSVRTLNRLYKRELDISPGRYYELIRLSHARSLAEETDHTAYAIAAATGFSSSTNLARAFKARFGVTLMSLRKSRPSGLGRSSGETA